MGFLYARCLHKEVLRNLMREMAFYGMYSCNPIVKLIICHSSQHISDHSPEEQTVMWFEQSVVEAETRQGPYKAAEEAPALESLSLTRFKVPA